MIKAVIVDDNKGARNTLKSIIDYNFENQFSFGEANGVLTAHKLIIEQQPDIVFLDIEMGDGTGIDLLKLFTEPNFKIIFTTAHKEYALDVIKYRAFDYLLKPINPFDLINAINSFKKVYSSKLKNQEKIVIKNQNDIVIINCKEILRLESDGSYTKIVTTTQTHIASKNLKHFENLLPTSNFIRVHKSHIVNSDFISSIDKMNQNDIILLNNDKVPVSYRKLKALTNFLQNLNN